MSFRDIGAIINKVKLQSERERGYAAGDTQPKLPQSRARQPSNCFQRANPL